MWIFLLAFMLIPVVLVGSRGFRCWRRFASHYATTRPPEGAVLPDSSAELVHIASGTGKRYWIGFSNMVTVRAAPDGLDLRLFAPFGWIPRPLRLPWSDFTGVVSRDGFEWCAFEHAGSGRFEVGLRRDALRMLKAAMADASDASV